MYCLFLYQLRNSADGDIDLRDFIPGRIIDDTGGRQTENRLEFFYCIAGGWTENTVGGHCRDRRVVLVDPVQLLLHLAHL